jgi:hypothetical protein
MKAKRIVRWTWLLTGVVAVYTAVVFGMRWQGNREWENTTRQREADADRKIVERYGDGELKVLMFYANPPRVRPGGKVLLCYGVANAKSVTMQPAVENVSPSLSRCVEANPSTDTRYTLVAVGRSGEQSSASVSVDVR